MLRAWRIVVLTDRQQDHAGHNNKDYHQASGPSASFPLVLGGGGELLSSSASVRGDVRNVRFDILCNTMSKRHVRSVVT